MANEYGNYTVFDELDPTPTTTLSNGNRLSTITGSNQNQSTTLAIPSTGKWSCQFKVTAIASGGNPMVGLVGDANVFYALYRFGGQSIVASGSGADASYGDTYAVNDFIDVLYDADADSLAFRKNGEDQGVAFTAVRARCTGEMFFGVRSSTATTVELNSGQTAFDTAIKSGYATLNTANLPATAIINPDDHYFSTVVTHDGNSTTSTCTFNLETFEWLAIIKNLDNTEKWYWINSVRGEGEYVSSNSDAVKTADANVLAISGTTFTLGSTLLVDDYLVEFHKAGLASATAANTEGAFAGDGASSDTVSTTVNLVSGFGYCIFTGENDNGVRTIGHGLEKAPEFVINKQLVGGGSNWASTHVGLTNATKEIYLNLNDDEDDNVNHRGANGANVLPSTTLMTYGTAGDTNGDGDTQLAIYWHSVEGYSSFGTYEGNGAADGTFIGTNLYGNGNFVKNIDSAGYSWHFVSTTVQGYNTGANPSIQFDTTGTGGTAAYDVVSTGLKMRTANINYNTAETFIYASWGGRPIQGAGGISQGRADGTVKPFGQAYGGNQILRVGNFWVHIFTTSGTFRPLAAITVEYLVIAGGAGGGYGGGGGAGGLKTATGMSLSDQSYVVTVGAGGTGKRAIGHSGVNSVFNGITSTGGGGGASMVGTAGNAANGGSGGGGGAHPTDGSAGAASPSGQGNAGGAGSGTGSQWYGGGGGGGGAYAVGAAAPNQTSGGAGGAGLSNSITGSARIYAAGGGGGGYDAAPAPGGGTGGSLGAGGSSGVGGAGGNDGTDALPGRASTGSGGGGAGGANNGGSQNPGNGGSGVVIIKYPIV